jgi:hypothetical protein
MALYHNPGYWRERAEEARSVGGQMKDPEARRAMLEIAAIYDGLAERAERHMAAHPHDH